MVRGQKAGGLLDREPRFAVQKSEHPLNVMNSSLDQLLNLHATQPAIAGSSTFQAVHQFTEPTFTLGCSFFTAAYSSVFLRSRRSAYSGS